MKKVKLTILFVFAILIITCTVFGCGNQNNSTPKSAEKNAQKIPFSALEDPSAIYSNQPTDAPSENEKNTSSIPTGYQNGDFYATLDIPAIDLSVKTYCADINGLGEKAQEITDKEDSAAYFTFASHEIVADHDYQGFKKILNASLGMEATFTDANNNIQTYKCTNTADGLNLAELFIVSNSVKGEDNPELKQDYAVNIYDIKTPYLILYTCNGDTTNVYVTLWQKTH